jgi:hypothetical protein
MFSEIISVTVMSASSCRVTARGIHGRRIIPAR